MGTPCCSSNTTCAWSWASPTASWCSSSAAISPTVSLPTSATTRRASPHTWGCPMTNSTDTPDSDPRPVLLEVRDVVVHYGRIEALHGVSLVVHEGELVTLLGSNGAGKTTMMRAISGLRRLTSGSVWFDGRDITGVKAHKRVTDGLIQAPEGRGVFPGMTVTENLEMGCYGRKFASKAEHNERLDWVLETFPRLAERKNQG